MLKRNLKIFNFKYLGFSKEKNPLLIINSFFCMTRFSFSHLYIFASPLPPSSINPPCFLFLVAHVRFDKSGLRPSRNEGKLFPRGRHSLKTASAVIDCMINVPESGQISSRDTNIGFDSIISSFRSCKIDINLFLISI